MAANTNIQALTVSNNSTPIPEIPKLPEKMIKLVPEMADWHGKMEEWRQKTQIAIHGVPGP